MKTLYRRINDAYFTDSFYIERINLLSNIVHFFIFVPRLNDRDLQHEYNVYVGEIFDENGNKYQRGACENIA